MHANESNNEKQPRKIRDAPFAWQHKWALRMITESFSESDQAASARSVYVAVTELASDNESQTFTATKALIAHKAGVSVKTVERLLKGFEQLGLIKVEKKFAERNAGAIRAPNRYTLLSIPAQRREVATTLRLKGSRSKSDKVEEHRRKKKNDDDTRAQARTRETVARQRANGESSSSNLVLELEEAKKDPLWPQFEDYCISKGGAPTLKGWKTWRPQQVQRNGAPKTSKPIPIAKRNKMINKLNEEKARIIHAFPDGRYAPWAEARLKVIQRSLEKL